MQVRHANDAELRRGSRFQHVVCSETRRWREEWRRSDGDGPWRMEDGCLLLLRLFFCGFC